MRQVATSQWHGNFRWARVALLGICVAFASLTSPAWADQSRNSLIVTLPNGYPNIKTSDLQVSSTAGMVQWVRQWNGFEWRFSPQWESLSTSWRNLTSSQITEVDYGPSGVSPGGLMGGGGGCGYWAWVDEDWSPAARQETVVDAAPLIPLRSTPFNAKMPAEPGQYPDGRAVGPEYAQMAQLTMGAAGCVSGGDAANMQDMQGIRKANELYVGDSNRFAFNNRTVLEKRAVRQLPPQAAATLDSSLATGRFVPEPVNNDKGFRWIDKAGTWMDYNTQGQVVAWGDRNNNTVWMVRDNGGTLRGVVDGNGHVMFTLHYSGDLLVELRDYPAHDTDMAARSVKYQYDGKNRLALVTDARGNTVRYDYDTNNHVVKITDQEGRTEGLAYNGDVVKQRTAPDGGVTDYEFDYDDANRQLNSKFTGPLTEGGRRVEAFTHNRAGKLVRRVVNGRTEEEVRRDTATRTESNTNARNFTTRLTRNEYEQIVAVAYADGSKLQSVYSAQHLGLVEQTDELGVRTLFTHDALGNELSMVQAAGTADERSTLYTRNALGQLTQIARKGRTEADGSVTPDAVWTITYDALGQVSTTTDAEGHTQRLAYDRAGNLVRYTDARGNTQRFDVDAHGNLTRVTDALGRVTQYRYDKVGNAIEQTNARGKTARTAYDALNRRTQATNTVGGQMAWQYNREGLPTQQTDEDGRARSASYDNFLRLVREADALGNTSEHAYTVPDGTGAGATSSLLGSLEGPTDTTFPSFTARRRYDERERLTSQTLVNGNSGGTEQLTSTRTYNARGQVTTATDAYGKTARWAYNALGELTAATDQLGNTTRLGYDAHGNLTTVTNANGGVHRFTYDRNGRVTSEALPLGQTTRYAYDAAGNLVERMDARGQKASHSYDAANRRTGSRYLNANGELSRSTTLTWDEADNLKAWSATDHIHNQTSSASATFDDANRKTAETFTYPSGYTLSYGQGFSAAGKKTQLVWPDGTAIGYGYSAHGELETVSVPGEGTLSVNQFKWVAPAKVTLPGGTAQERSFDGLLNLEGLKVNNPSQQTVLSLANRYGKVQELKTSSRTDSTGAASTVKDAAYSYDDELRLVRSEVSGNTVGNAVETFTLDALGNRVAHSAVQGAWTYDANNRLLQRGTGANATRYLYDDAGNLVRKTEGADAAGQVTEYRYDAENRMVEVSVGAGLLVARYGYDPLGRRLWKEVYRNRQGNQLPQAQRIHYLYNEEGLVAEATQALVLNADRSVSASGNPELGTQYGPRPGATFNTGVLLLKTKNSNGQDIVAYLHYDHLNTPMLATDKGGRVVWAVEYNVFGFTTLVTQVVTADRPTIEVQLRFAGQTEDTEIGYYYNYFRYYDAQVGRYTQSDPIGLVGGINTYAYVGGNPISYTDPQGLFVPALGPLIVWGVPIVAAGAWAAMNPGAREALSRGWDALTTWAKPPENAYDPNGPKAPGKPTDADGFKDPRGGENWVPNPNPGKGGSAWGWQDAKGDVWCPSGQGGRSHGGPHWDVQTPGGDYRNVRPRR